MITIVIICDLVCRDGYEVLLFIKNFVLKQKNILIQAFEFHFLTNFSIAFKSKDLPLSFLVV